MKMRKLSIRWFSNFRLCTNLYYSYVHSWPPFLSIPFPPFLSLSLHFLPLSFHPFSSIFHPLLSLPITFPLFPSPLYSERRMKISSWGRSFLPSFVVTFLSWIHSTTSIWRHIVNPFVPTVPTFAVRKSASLGIMRAPRVPPLNPSESIVLSYLAS